MIKKKHKKEAEELLLTTKIPSEGGYNKKIYIEDSFRTFLCLAENFLL